MLVKKPITIVDHIIVVIPSTLYKVVKGIEALSSISLEADRLPEQQKCKHCGAQKLYSESVNFCCSDGEVVLEESKMLDILIELFTSGTEKAICFRTYVRTYNSTFTFTSFLGLKL